MSSYSAGGPPEAHGPPSAFCLVRPVGRCVVILGRLGGRAGGPMGLWIHGSIGPWSAALGRGRRSRDLRKLLPDVPRSKLPAFPPVRVPVGSVGAPPAGRPAASDHLLAEGDLPPASGIGEAAAQIGSQAGDQQPPGEDEQPSEVVLVEGSHLSDHLPVQRHLVYERTQADPRVKSDGWPRLGSHAVPETEKHPAGARSPAGRSTRRLRRAGGRPPSRAAAPRRPRLQPEPRARRAHRAAAIGAAG